MKLIHNQLDSLRSYKEEEEAIERAENFFHTNKIILRNSFQRFKHSISSLRRLKFISVTFKRIYSSYLRHL